MENNRIQQLLVKLLDMSNDQQSKSTIDVDLMLDYTRVIYADLLEWRRNLTIDELAQVDNLFTKNINNNGPVSTSSASEKEIVLEKPAPAVEKIRKDLIHDAVMHESAKESIDLEEFIPSSIQPVQEVIESTKVDTITDKNVQKDIRKLIGLGDKYLFMNELFKNDKFDYETVLDIINNAENEKKIASWLDKEYIETHKWSKDDETVDMFYFLIKRFFTSK